MSLGIAMKDLLFAVWKNSSRPKIGQFELSQSSGDSVGDANSAERQRRKKRISKLVLISFLVLMGIAAIWGLVSVCGWG